MVDFIDAYLPFFKPIDDLDILPIQLANWPVFNLADSAIFVGVVFYLVFGFMDARRKPEDTDATEASEDEG